MLMLYSELENVSFTLTLNSPVFRSARFEYLFKHENGDLYVLTLMEYDASCFGGFELCSPPRSFALLFPP